MMNKTSPSNLGTVVSVRGSVVDINFDDHLPSIYSLLHAGIIEDRQDTLRAAYDKHPERFKYRIPKPMVLPEGITNHC